VFQVKEHVHVKAPIELCFELAGNLALAGPAPAAHLLTDECRRHAAEIKLCDRIVSRGWILGVLGRHESVITRVEVPTALEERMVRGSFRRFEQRQSLAEIEGHTLVISTVRFSLPLGAPGRLLARRFLVPHITRILRRRMGLIKEAAERRNLEEGTLAGVA